MPRSPAASPAPAPPTFPAVRDAPSDGADEYITGFAGGDGSIVAVGGSGANGVSQPLFLRSTDDGRTWSTGSVTGQSRPSLTPGDDAEIVLHARGQYLALGEPSDGVSLWTSDNGLAWTRHAAAASVFTPMDRVSAITASSLGYVAVGYTAPSGSRYAPTVWSSPDGLAWTKHPASSMGVPLATGNGVSMSGVAVDPTGHVLVAVGSAESETDHRKPEYGVVWHSSDGGRTWSRSGASKDLAGTGTRGWFSEVRWIDNRFVAVGTGGDFSSGHYAGVVATSDDGVSWRSDWRGPALAPAAETYLATVTGHGADIVAMGVTRGVHRSVTGVHGSPGAWRRTQLATAGEGSSMDVDALFTTQAGTVLLAGSANPHGDSDARIWRSVDAGHFTRVDIPTLDRGHAPVSRVQAISSGQGRYLVVGSSAGLPVVWLSTDGMRFHDPVVLSRDPADEVSTISYGATGWVVTGSQSTGTNPAAVGWQSRDGRTWTRSKAGAFGAAGPFAYSTLNGAAFLKGRAVVVGVRSPDGAIRQSAIAYTATTTGTWRSADDHTSTLVPSGALSWDAVYDLDGAISGTRTMTDVAAAGAGLVAVGNAQSSAGSQSSRPAVWSSTDGVTRRLHMLALPAGTSSASIAHVAAHGATVVGFGSAAIDGHDQPYVWTSNDGGSRWAARRLSTGADPLDEVDEHFVRTTPTGFVAGGTVGRRGSHRAMIWASADGRSWHAVSVLDSRLSVPGDVSVSGADVVGRTLRALVTRISSNGRVNFTVAVPV